MQEGRGKKNGGVGGVQGENRKVATDVKFIITFRAPRGKKLDVVFSWEKGEEGKREYEGVTCPKIVQVVYRLDTV